MRAKRANPGVVGPAAPGSPSSLLTTTLSPFSVKTIPMSHDHSGHSHDHDDHGHTHAHAPASFGKAFAIGIALNLGFVVIEALYGLISNSVSLLADAGTISATSSALAPRGSASVLAQRAPTARFTYGLRGSSILAALFNAVFCW